MKVKPGSVERATSHSCNHKQLTARRSKKTLRPWFTHLSTIEVYPIVCAVVGVGILFLRETHQNCDKSCASGCCKQASRTTASGVLKSFSRRRVTMLFSSCFPRAVCSRSSTFKISQRVSVPHFGDNYFSVLRKGFRSRFFWICSCMPLHQENNQASELFVDNSSCVLLQNTSRTPRLAFLGKFLPSGPDQPDTSVYSLEGGVWKNVPDQSLGTRDIRGTEEPVSFKTIFVGHVFTVQHKQRDQSSKFSRFFEHNASKFLFVLLIL